MWSGCVSGRRGDTRLGRVVSAEVCCTVIRRCECSGAGSGGACGCRGGAVGGGSCVGAEDGRRGSAGTGVQKWAMAISGE